MQRFYSEKRDVYGRVEPSASVSVFVSGTPVLATIYNASDPLVTPTVPIGNPIYTGSNGEYGFAAPDGIYDIVVQGSGAIDYKKAISLSVTATVNPPQDSSQVTYLAPYAGAVVTTQNIINDEWITIFRFMTVAQKIAWNANQATYDMTAIIQAAFNSFTHQTSWVLYFPVGTYHVTSKLSLLNQQNICIMAYGAQITGNFNDTVLQIGDLSGTNDINWSSILGLIVVQSNTGASAKAVVAQHNYSVAYRDVYFYGGQYAFSLDGNGNHMDSSTLKGAIIANFIETGGGNNEVNLLTEVHIENGSGYGAILTATAGVGGHTELDHCYIEANTLGGVRVVNNAMFRIAGTYFNLTYQILFTAGSFVVGNQYQILVVGSTNWVAIGAASNTIGVIFTATGVGSGTGTANYAPPGIILDGTVGAPNGIPYGVVENNRIQGHASLTPNFIQEASAVAVNCAYQNNQVESGNCNLYGAAPMSINRGRRGDKVYVANSDAFTGGPPPTGWTMGNGGVASTAASISPYGSAASLVVTNAGGYAYITISAPINALLRISVWALTATASTGVAQVAAWSAGLGGALKIATTNSLTATRVEMYLSPAERSNAATFVLMLRDQAGTSATFADIKIEDMTN